MYGQQPDPRQEIQKVEYELNKLAHYVQNVPYGSMEQQQAQQRISDLEMYRQQLIQSIQGSNNFGGGSRFAGGNNQFAGNMGNQAGFTYSNTGNMNQTPDTSAGDRWSGGNPSYESQQVNTQPQPQQQMQPQEQTQPTVHTRSAKPEDGFEFNSLLASGIEQITENRGEFYIFKYEGHDKHEELLEDLTFTTGSNDNVNLVSNLDDMRTDLTIEALESGKSESIYVEPNVIVLNYIITTKNTDKDLWKKITNDSNSLINAKTIAKDHIGIRDGSMEERNTDETLKKKTLMSINDVLTNLINDRVRYRIGSSTRLDDFFEDYSELISLSRDISQTDTRERFKKTFDDFHKELAFVDESDLRDEEYDDLKNCGVITTAIPTTVINVGNFIVSYVIDNNFKENNDSPLYLKEFSHPKLFRIIDDIFSRDITCHKTKHAVLLTENHVYDVYKSLHQGTYTFAKVK